MVFWRTNANARLRSCGQSRISEIACLAAALFMVFGASYAAAHDHDDHAVDFDGECVVCVATAINAVKLSPDEPLIRKPTVSLLGVLPFESSRFTNRFNPKSTFARGPPLFVPAD